MTNKTGQDKDRQSGDCARNDAVNERGWPEKAPRVDAEAGWGAIEGRGDEEERQSSELGG